MTQYWVGPGVSSARTLREHRRASTKGRNLSSIFQTQDTLLMSCVSLVSQDFYSLAKGGYGAGGIQLRRIDGRGRLQNENCHAHLGMRIRSSLVLPQIEAMDCVE